VKIYKIIKLPVGINWLFISEIQNLCFKYSIQFYRVLNVSEKCEQPGFFTNSITDKINISCIHVAIEKFIFLAEASQDWWLEPTKNLLEPARYGWSRLEPAGAGWSRLEPTVRLQTAPARAGAGAGAGAGFV
jgi:hypothetical protein